MRKILALAATAAFAATLAAHAQTPDFATVDADASGEVSLEEMTAAGATVTQEEFTAADTDGSGGLNAEEFAAATAG